MVDWLGFVFFLIKKRFSASPERRVKCLHVKREEDAMGGQVGSNGELLEEEDNKLSVTGSV